ncbi:MAG: hypothetical protein NUV67_02835 [archaeon]|nr:hypothetical protein [archaeon]
MLAGNVITTLGLAGILFSATSGAINIGFFVGASFIVLIGVALAFNQAKQNEPNKAQSKQMELSFIK